MAGKLGKYQVTPGFTSWKGMTSANHIGSIFKANPQKASNIMVQLLANSKGKTLESLLSRFPTKNFETKDDYTWDIVGSHRRNIPLVEARHLNGNAVQAGEMVGVNGEPFYLVFAEDWFARPVAC